MTERRVVITFGVAYGTAAAKLAWIPKFVREAVESIDGLRFDRSHFKGYGDFSLEFETVLYVLSPDYALYMDRQEKLLLTIYEAFEREGIAFAARTVPAQRPEATPA
jgi:small-conductance mechanosensitive channel